ncbi:beta-lactamase/transpeptidase-like protein [Setomelanomma holmii]|uniref:Beta-lactamase/transpeptidase-like protein n=1 Tax=Setomelanomma holmii TaxID=210430 RepID=A0A9P4LHF3_9PLEO|nr:beta-lactamase/transpeptidase-like protein [Setomelanomma holmii]
MSFQPHIDDACERAVTPGPDRVLAGVALAAVVTRGKGTRSAVHIPFALIERWDVVKTKSHATPNVFQYPSIRDNANACITDEHAAPPDFKAAYGTLQLDPASPPVTTKTVMWTASCNKLATIIAVLQCVERGLFALDYPADVNRLLPEWNDPEILTGFTEDSKPIVQPAKQKITLRQLLTHTSWVYGGGLDLAGLMLARATKATLEAYMRRNIFDVLGMNDAPFGPLEHNNMAENLMSMTSRVDTGLVDGYTPGALETPIEPQDEYGGAGLFSTADDFLKLLKSVLHDGKLLKSESIDLMFTPALSVAQRESQNAWLSNPVVAAIMTPGESLVGTLGAGEWVHGIGGMIRLHEGDDGLKPGTMHWGGAPNLKSWIDRTGGTCGFFGPQLLPSG